VIVPRRLGSAQVGIYTLGLAASGVLLVLVGLGLRPLLVREIAANPERAPQLIGTGIVLRAIFCLPALAVTLVITLVGPFRGVEGTAVFLGWCMTVFAVVSEPIAAGFQAMEKMRYLTYSTIFSKTLSTVSGIALVLLGVRATGLLLAYVVIGAALTVLVLIWSRPHFDIDWRVTRHELRRLFIASLPYWSFVAFFTIYLWIDSLMLGAMTSTTVLGWYGLPTQLFGTLMFIPTVLSTAWLAQLVRAHKGGAQSLIQAARPAIELVLVLSMPVCVGAVLVAAPLVRAAVATALMAGLVILALRAGLVAGIVTGMITFPLLAGLLGVLTATERHQLWDLVVTIAPRRRPRPSGSRS